MQDYHQLDIWNRAMDYAVAVYKFAASLPEEEKYNLASQLRRAASSVPLNISEGCGAASNTEFGRFLGYAYQSPQDPMESLIDEGNQISRMTYKLMQTLDPDRKSQ